MQITTTETTQNTTIRLSPRDHIESNTSKIESLMETIQEASTRLPQQVGQWFSEWQEVFKLYKADSMSQEEKLDATNALSYLILKGIEPIFLVIENKQEEMQWGKILETAMAILNDLVPDHNGEKHLEECESYDLQKQQFPMQMNTLKKAFDQGEERLVDQANLINEELEFYDKMIREQLLKAHELSELKDVSCSVVSLTEEMEKLVKESKKDVENLEKIKDNLEKTEIFLEKNLVIAKNIVENI